MSTLRSLTERRRRRGPVSSARAQIGQALSLEGDPALITDDTQMALAVAWASSPDYSGRRAARRMRACALLADGRR